MLFLLLISLVHGGSLQQREARNKYSPIKYQRNEEPSYVENYPGFLFKCNGAADVLVPSNYLVKKKLTESGSSYGFTSDEKEVHNMNDLESRIGDVTTILKKMEKAKRKDVDKKMNEMHAKIEKLEEDKKHLMIVCRDPCIAPFILTAGRCIYIALEARNVTWQEARDECQDNGSDLIVFKDANDYAEIVKKLKAIFGDETNIKRWIGGTDLDEEDNWKWINGRSMPRGAPFWGTRDKYILEPSGGDAQNCAGVLSSNHFYLHDYPCAFENSNSGPICEYHP